MNELLHSAPVPVAVAPRGTRDSKVERVQEFSGGRDLAPMAYAIRARGMTTLNDAIVVAEILFSLLGLFICAFDEVVVTWMHHREIFFKS